MTLIPGLRFAYISLLASTARAQSPFDANEGVAPKGIRTAHEHGHFYSPVVDPRELLSQQARLWPAHPKILGIDFDDAEHERILREVFPLYIGEYDYPERPEETSDPTSFYTRNTQFSWLDSRTLFVMLRHLKPKRFIEIGSGFSTLLTADVNHRFLGGRLELTCVEPYPRKFLRGSIAGLTRRIEDKVQNVPLSVFEDLRAGDVLFIDSSHVAKTGSDVNFIYFEILPRLAKGVFLHIHDILFPHDYPKDWVLSENRSWNEQYLVRALLMDSTRLRVKFGCSYAFYRFPDLVKDALALPTGRSFAGASLWIETI